MWYLITFVIVFVFNLVPAFAPPTWMLLSYIRFAYRPSGVVLAILGAFAATLGRLLLAHLSQRIIRNQLFSQATRQNIDALREYLSKRQKLTIGVFILYALGPLPSNQIFLAYGLTGLPLRNIATPFFFGRLVSYAFWIFFVSSTAQLVAADTLTQGKFLGGYFVITQFLILATVYLFAKLDWHHLIKERKLRWMHVVGH